MPSAPRTRSCWPTSTPCASGWPAKQKIPAYLVFSDATLREMVQKKPFSTDELLNITGVGEKKAARYGTIFLAAIEEAVSSR